MSLFRINGWGSSRSLVRESVEKMEVTLARILTYNDKELHTVLR